MTCVLCPPFVLRVLSSSEPLTDSTGYRICPRILTQCSAGHVKEPCIRTGGYTIQFSSLVLSASCIRRSFSYRWYQTRYFLLPGTLWLIMHCFHLRRSVLASSRDPVLPENIRITQTRPVARR